jgi:NAD(P)-dependent dehydrogenase (short-subunit alcohol dehydrogenase family)
MSERAALVTAASSGIGLGASLRLAEKGLSVYASMHNLTRVLVHSGNRREFEVLVR